MLAALLRTGLFGVLLIGSWPGLAQSDLPTDLVTTNVLSLTWNPSPSQGVAGYSLYWGLTGETCTNRLDVAKVTAATLLLGRLETNVVYHFTVVARDETGEESAASNMIQYLLTGTRPRPRARRPFVTNWKMPEPPRLPWLEFQGSAGDVYQVQSSTNLLDWQVAFTTNCVDDSKVSLDLPYSPEFPQRFFRLVRQR